MAKRVFCAVLVFLGLAAAILGLTDVGSPISETIKGLKFWSEPEPEPFYKSWTDYDSLCNQEDTGLRGYFSSTWLTGYFSSTWLTGSLTKSEKSGYLTSGFCSVYRTVTGPSIFNNIGYVTGRLQYYVRYLLGQNVEEKAFNTGFKFLDSVLNYVWGIRMDSIRESGYNCAVSIGNCFYDIGHYIVMDIWYYYSDRFYQCVTGVVSWPVSGAGSLPGLLFFLSEIVFGVIAEMVVYAMLSFHFAYVAALCSVSAFACGVINFFRNRFKETAIGEQRREAREQDQPESLEMDYVKALEHFSVLHTITNCKSSSRETLESAAFARGYVVQDVPRDGNCLFSSVSEQLKRFEQTLSPYTLRQMSVMYLAKNPVLSDGTPLEAFQDEGTWQAYLNRMSKDGEWGDHIVLTALAEVMKRTIVILSGNDSITEIRIEPSAKSVDNNATITLGHISEVHYVSLIKSNNVESVDSVTSGSEQKAVTP